MVFDDVRMKGFSKNMKVQEAIDLAVKKLEPLPIITLFLKETSIQNYILKETIYAKRTSPPFDRSAVDGYAIRAEDSFSASESNPMLVKVVDSINMGVSPLKKVEKGFAVQVPTGGVIPDGANAVIMIEDTNKIDNDYLELYAVLPPGKNISKKGEDIKEGEMLFETGHKLRSVDRGFLLSAGITEIKVSKLPTIAIIVTGDELTEPWNFIAPGQIPEINSFNLFDLCLDENWKPIKVGIIKDNEEDLRNAIEKTIASYDVVFINAGTSVGKRDLAPVILHDLGDIIFHGLAMRPGGPVLCAKVDKKIVFGIPGFPTASIIAFRFIIRPIIRSLLGLSDHNSEKTVPAKISRNVSSKLGRMDFLRVKLVKYNIENYIAEPIQIGGSGILKNIIQADGFVIIPESSEGLKEGDLVEVVLW